jgi:hypothetical protein
MAGEVYGVRLVCSERPSGGSPLHARSILEPVDSRYLL